MRIKIKLITSLLMSIFLGAIVYSADARTIYVNDDMPADFNNIQAAINDANVGDIIEVKPGTYTGVGNRDIDFKGKAITVRSTNPEDPNIVASTVIDCQGAGRGFYFHSGEDANSILNGLKITNGYVITSSPGGNAGAGIYCGNNSGPTIANCDISDNTAAGNPFAPLLDARGGGLYGCNGTIINCKISGNKIAQSLTSKGLGGGLYGCNGTITNCIISGNAAATDPPSPGSKGGGLCACNGTITNCTISGNTAAGGGLGGGLSECNVTIINCNISGNTSAFGGGLYNCNETITNCIISGNQGGGLRECNATIINCSISGNAAANGGGLYSCNGTISNCTISGNTANGEGPVGGIGGGLYACNGTITNCIIWGNMANVDPELYLSSYPNYSCVKDWIGDGIGNIVDDPCFADPCNGDYHLNSQAGRWDTKSESWIVDDVTSPCIDTGDFMFPIGLEPFPNGGIINMGAYGGTVEASKSYFGEPICVTVIAGDINGDCIVNFKDFAFMSYHWLEDNTPLPPPPGQASNPNPADGATSVSTTADLSWTAGSYAASHDLYFGTSSPPPFIRNQTAATFDPGTMAPSTTYYWRIDEVNLWGTTTGTIWSFTTMMSPPL